ncbi:MHS family shikimate/dehydroshikimate transporter-like MFS transporter [Paraburkholderia sp. GAS199]|uniref:MFS transporter n=1 Tax=Paraburkholderia sp. GAS199 TaxID=3035126 RepID=UPI003D1AAD71
MTNFVSHSTVGDRARHSSATTVLFASVLGSVIEWYDFLLYGTATALVFNKLFFPSFEPVVGIISAFGAYAAGFVARPVGAIIFGHFGDRFGRTTTLALTVAIMGGGTFLIGCLPTYGQIGVAAPILLVLLRVVQGIGLGGEWGGAVLLAIEHAPRHRRGLFGSIVQLGWPLGIVTSVSAFALLAPIDSASFLSWGWRIPFWLSLILMVLALFIRLRVAETPAFKNAFSERRLERVPLLAIVQDQRRSFLLAVGLKLSEIGLVVVLTVFAISYVTGHLGLSKDVILNAVVMAALLELVTIPMFGWLSDRLGRRIIFIAGCVFTIGFAFPLFMLLDTRDPLTIAITVVIAVNLGHASMFAAESAWMSELFPTQLRYTGASMGFQVGGALAGGFVPLIAAILMRESEGKTWPISIMIIALAAITLAASLVAPDTYDKRID